jgi:hypothetical protein
MKQGMSSYFSIAVAGLALLAPALVRAEGVSAHASEDVAATSGVNTAVAQQEADQMVSVKAHLLRTIDARKTQAGDQFLAVVDDTVHLKNGTELPRGTELIGTIATDQMKAGTSQLGLRFTQAKFKNGEVVPIEAMIAGVAAPVGDYSSDYDEEDDLPSWNSGTLQVDETGALSNVNLHSVVAASDSGTFLSRKKDDVKLPAGSRMTLAVAPQGNDNTTAAGSE